MVNQVIKLIMGAKTKKSSQILFNIYISVPTSIIPIPPLYGV